MAIDPDRSAQSAARDPQPPAGQSKPSRFAGRPRGDDRSAPAGRVGLTGQMGRHAIAAILAPALLLTLTLAGTRPSFAQQDRMNPILPRIALNAGIHRIQAEVADSPQKRQRGLMMREKLGPNEGMLFVFEDQAVHCFWMKNTPLPLSIAFIGEDGTVVNIADMTPFSEDSHCPSKPIRYALEMEQGWFAHKGVAAGQRIGGLQNRPAGG